LLGAFGALLLLRAVTISARDILMFRLQVRFVQSQQTQIAEGLAAAEWSYLAAFDHARMNRVMSGDMQRLGTGIQFALRGAMAAIMAASQCTLAFILSPTLAMLLLASLAACALVLRPMTSRARAIGGEIEDANLALLASTGRFLGGLKLAVSQRLELGFVAEVRETLEHLSEEQIHFATQHVLGQAILTTLLGLLAAAAVTIGLFVFKAPPSLVVTLLLIVARLTAPLNQIQQGVQQFAHLLAVYEKIEELQSELKRHERRAKTRPICPISEGAIVFDDVSFRHPDDRGGLRDFSLTIDPGEFLAFVGPSGSGKTTFADLLCGLYAPQSGRITIGTDALTASNLESWRDALAYVPQDAFLFRHSIRRNIAWANTSAREEDLWAALSITGADALVRRAEKGLDTIVGERGILVSGGERQRFALARALLRRPRLLLLDEATNALDGASERDILVRLRKLENRPTVVFIAHRTDNIALFDRVIHIEGGRLMRGRPGIASKEPAI
jgi:ATP-binding cassette subfamily C protein